jgi:hypothetical protein
MSDASAGVTAVSVAAVAISEAAYQTDSRSGAVVRRRVALADPTGDA